ncbi:restriction endonuclease subunit S [Oceanirhabdus seepicola]|uniref:Restriction endonuclease subunit S n=1 Tax=Oceanirhabdus seepicola TaxID=2828781 RepID=A0A9J6P575_9CLOT|nr:restriction endonuclease subunit S [Oceanirhabdus seepicola]MCM1991302.1 restriction endonuclease subunit S [Oceanirhabdus seepicola]
MKTVNITKVCDIEIGKTPARKENSYWGKGAKWISISDMKTKYINNTKEEITNKAIQESKIKLVPQNTVIMSFKLSVGKVAITGENMYTNEAIAAFHIKSPEELSFEYLYYALQTLRLNENTDRAVMGLTLNKKKLAQLMIPLPPLQTQKKIVEVLKKAQELIDLRKKQIELFDELIQSVFYDMFGDPVTNPKGWEVKSLKDFVKIDTNMISEFSDYLDYPHIGISNIEKNTGKLINYKTIKEDNVISGKYYFGPEHIIYSKIRPNLNKVALPNFKGLCSADSYPLLVNKSKANRFYVVQILRSEYFLNEILKHSNRTNIPKVNKSQLMTFECILPPVELQNQFSQKVQKIEAQKELMQQSLTEMENNFNSLMQKAFKGELFN